VFYVLNNEFAILMTHPRVGCDIIAGIEFPWPIAQIILQHHEKINGTGYPQALSGKDILLEARILCGADVVEAMASHRPYRPELGIEGALNEISENKGLLYDPDVVDALSRISVSKIEKNLR
jgi:HD-GYP domain-containing protein (c-di-GMP phosphodiesterase class II)